eukprot:234229-Amphidinium_carterae.1
MLLLNALNGRWSPSQRTPLRADLVESYVRDSGDPEVDLATWLRDGTPFGAVNPITQNSIFPACEEQVGDHQSDTHMSLPPGWSNYESAEDCPSVVEELLNGMVARGWAEVYDSVEEMRRRHGSTVDIVINRLGLISKVKPDGRIKHRLVWDLRRSGVNSRLRQGQRVVLPRLRDLVDDFLHIARAQRGHRLHFTIADVADAFHLIPVMPEETFLQTTAFNGRIYRFLVLVFGSRVAPTLWGRTSAFLSRSAQSIVPCSTTRLETFVDDPVIVTSGDSGH